MLIKIKHFKDGLAQRVVDVTESSNYELVAEMNFEGNTVNEGLEAAFRSTNSVMGCWSFTPDEWDSIVGEGTNGDYDHRVVRKRELHNVGGRTLGLRSSSVGDIFEADGVDYVVMGMGFKSLSDLAREEPNKLVM